MALAPYQYTPLSSESSLRLIRLKGTSGLQRLTEAVEIELFEVSLQDAPAFEAVSYAWDHADEGATLMCNGRQLHVSAIVLEIIRTLDRISSIGVFWIDAVCIDQSSTSDKNAQVPRMRIMFSEALRVWIWLGKGSYESRFAMELLVEMDAKVTAGQLRTIDDWESSTRTYRGELWRT